MQDPTHELWLIYKELEEVTELSQVEPLRDRIGKVINALNKPMSVLGAAGGAVKSEAKSKSSAENGKKGGRPRK